MLERRTLVQICLFLSLAAPAAAFMFWLPEPQGRNNPEDPKSPLYRAVLPATNTPLPTVPPGSSPTPTPSATPSPTRSNTPNASCPSDHSFESGDTTGWNLVGGDLSGLAISTAQAQCGTQSLKADANFPAGADSRFQLVLPAPRNLVSEPHVTFRVYLSSAMAAGSNLQLLLANGAGFTWNWGASGTVDPTQGGVWLTLTHDFTGTTDLADTRELLLWVYSQGAWTGTIWVDEVDASASAPALNSPTPSATRTPTPAGTATSAPSASATPTHTASFTAVAGTFTSTPSATPSSTSSPSPAATATPGACLPAQFDFESGLVPDWYAPDAPFTAPVADTTQAYCGTGSLMTTAAVTVAASHRILHRWSAGYDMSADGKVVTWRVRLSPAMPAGSDMKLILAHSPGYSYEGYVGTVAADQGDTWLTVSYDFTGYGTVNFSDIRELILNIWVNGAWSGTVWVDDVKWGSGVGPSATPSPTFSPSPTTSPTPSCGSILAADGSDFEGASIAGWSNPGWDPDLSGLTPATDQAYCGTYSASCTAAYAASSDGFIIYEFAGPTDLTAQPNITFHIRTSPAMPSGSGFNIAIADSAYAWAGYLGWTADPAADSWFTVTGDFSAISGVDNCRQIILLAHTGAAWNGTIWIDHITW